MALLPEGVFSTKGLTWTLIGCFATELLLAIPFLAQKRNRKNMAEINSHHRLIDACGVVLGAQND